MPIIPPDTFNQWFEDEEGCVCEFFVNEYYDTDPKKDEENMRKHVLLEFLDYLGVLRYSRGYDGLYYEIYIEKRRKR